MKNLLSGMAIGLVIGAIAVWASFDVSDEPDFASTRNPVRDIAAGPKISLEAASNHRSARFESLSSIQETLSLPSDFDQTEALYVIAGRSNSSEVQNLIYQANRVADESDRRAALSILFLRLTDIDPRSAVAIASQPQFRGNNSIESSIWRLWSRTDFGEALAAAKTLEPQSRKEFAAQIMYVANGLTGNEKTRRIQAELGVAPSNSVKYRYLRELADESAQRAFDYINGLHSMQEQITALQYLSTIVARNNPQQAPKFAALIEKAALRTHYTNGVKKVLAEDYPQKIIEQHLRQPRSAQDRRYLSVALASLAKTDLESALKYFDQLGNSPSNLSLASSLLQAMVQSDPERTLEWARSRENIGGQNLYQYAVMAVANVDAELALREIDDYSGEYQKDEMYVVVLSAIAKTDPKRATLLLEQIPDGERKNAAAQTISVYWAQSDPESAMNWAIENQNRFGPEVLAQASTMYIMQNPDAAIQMLPGLDKKTQRDWSQKIVGALMQTQSLSAATTFVEQHRDSPIHAELLSVLIPQIAARDIDTALDTIGRMSPGKHRDQAYVDIVNQRVQVDPYQTAGLLSAINDENLRARAAASLVNSWARSDLAAAGAWVESQPAGAARDSAIAVLVNRHPAGDAKFLSLIDAMADEKLRKQTRTSYVVRVGQHNSERALNLLNGMNFTDAEREQIMTMIEQYKNARTTHTGLHID